MLTTFMKKEIKKEIRRLSIEKLALRIEEEARNLTGYVDTCREVKDMANVFGMVDLSHKIEVTSYFLKIASKRMLKVSDVQNGGSLHQFIQNVGE